MPGTLANLGRNSRINSSALNGRQDFIHDEFEQTNGRSERGLSFMKIRPVLPVNPTPPTPTLEKNDSTLGSLRTIAASCCWLCTIWSKETPCAPSVLISNCPVSSLGIKPFGH